MSLRGPIGFSVNQRTTETPKSCSPFSSLHIHTHTLSSCRQRLRRPSSVGARPAEADRPLAPTDDGQRSRQGSAPQSVLASPTSVPNPQRLCCWIPEGSHRPPDFRRTWLLSVPEVKNGRQTSNANECELIGENARGAEATRSYRCSKCPGNPENTYGKIGCAVLGRASREFNSAL